MKKLYFFTGKTQPARVQVRLAGCQSACFKSGIDFSSENIFEGEPSDTDLVSKIKIVPKKTGILCANDSTAAVLMSSLSKSGTQVGLDTLIAGFDDMKYAKHLQVPLNIIQATPF